ncbi:ABC transporter ATP-binding protein [Clostridium sp. MSJ-11]|uniref:ABC transporter ATP-binding protein n=1 Tax=Clostridium mobile TaxID=2841512 RepID=A0ABS6EHN1_9CLOT|nr:ABC transporter ATP-binding protein [Clostridium mobile]MBU5484725.1 ABC transporter ATP-binding protein [Clostridium mobile]
MSLIEVKNVVKRFDDKLILDSISFNIEKGEVYGFIGPNGAGKTTLINIMIGLLKANSGEIFVGGHSIKEEPLKVKGQIGLVPQELALMETVTAYDNLEFFGALYGLNGKLLKERIEEALEVIGLKDKRKEKVKKFSGGMKRRLNIAAAIMHRPKILILDEPTVGIDPQSRNNIFEFTRKINRENDTTIIYISHYMEEVEHLCNKLFIMDLGREIASGSIQEIKALIGEKDKIKLNLGGYKGELLLKLKELPGVKQCGEENGLINIFVDKKDFTLNYLLNLLQKSNVEIKGINFEEPTLEEVFLSLTGKKLRD